MTQLLDSHGKGESCVGLNEGRVIVVAGFRLGKTGENSIFRKLSCWELHTYYILND